MRRFPIVLSLAAALALVGCAGDPEPQTPDAEATETSSATASSAPEPSSDADTPTYDLASWEITTHGIGPFEVGSTIAEVADLTGVDYTDVVDTTASCIEFPLSYEPTLAHMSALAETGGFEGTVDIFTVFDWQFEGIATPRTAEGLGLGSTLADIAAIYGDSLQTAPWSLDADVTRAWAISDDGLGIQFLVNEDEGAFEIAVGRDPQVTYETGCASVSP